MPRGFQIVRLLLTFLIKGWLKSLAIYLLVIDLALCSLCLVSEVKFSKLWNKGDVDGIARSVSLEIDPIISSRVLLNDQLLSVSLKTLAITLLLDNQFFIIFLPTLLETLVTTI